MSSDLFQKRLHSEHDDDNTTTTTNNNLLTSQALNPDGTPKRPMNAFMIFARRRRPQVSAENTSMRTGEISKLLSKEWNAMSKTNKQFYLDQARKLKDSFNARYPDYVYKRRPNNSRKRRRPDLSNTEEFDLEAASPRFNLSPTAVQSRSPTEYETNESGTPDSQSLSESSSAYQRGYPFPDSQRQQQQQPPQPPSLLPFDITYEPYYPRTAFDRQYRQYLHDQAGEPSSWPPPSAPKVVDFEHHSWTEPNHSFATLTSPFFPPDHRHTPTPTNPQEFTTTPTAATSSSSTTTSTSAADFDSRPTTGENRLYEYDEPQEHYTFQVDSRNPPRISEPRSHHHLHHIVPPPLHSYQSSSASSSSSQDQQQPPTSLQRALSLQSHLPPLRHLSHSLDSTSRHHHIRSQSRDDQQIRHLAYHNHHHHHSSDNALSSDTSQQTYWDVSSHL